MRIIRLSVSESDLRRNCKGTPRTGAQDDKKGKTQYWAVNLSD